MADNVQITSGSGTTIATDDVAGVNYQQVKLVDGTLDSTTAIAAGGGVEAGALRVTIATDSTGVVSVDDNGSSLTVDGTVTANLAAGTNNIGDVDVLTVPAPLSTTGGGTEATALRVTIASDSTGVLSVDDNGSSLTVDGSVTVTQATAANLNATVTQATAANLNATVVQATAANLNATVVQATAANLNATVTGFSTAGTAAFTKITDGVNTAGLAGTSQVVTGFTTTSNYAYVRLTDGTNVATVGANGGIEITGGTIHGTTDSGNPLKLGAKAESSIVGTPNVNDGYRTDLYADLDGVLITKPFCTFGDILTQRIFDTAGNSTAFTVFGSTASQRNYITTLTVYNSSTTNGYVDFRDGVAGSTFFTVPLPALGGATINFPIPLKQPTVNQQLAYDVSAAISSTIISLVGFKGY
jgi:hypothetical protein